MGVANITSARAKLRRANEHLDALEAAMTRALNDVSNASRLEFGRDGPWHLIIFHPDGYPIEQTHRWATMMGDAINNTRAALDHTVWQLILREDKKPGKTNYFPLFTDRQEFLNKVKAPPKQFKKRSPLYGIPVGGDAWTLIERAQPYQRPQPDIDPFALLAKFSNVDKHRALLVGHEMPKLGDLSRWLGWKTGVQPTERIDGVTPLWKEKPTELCRLKFSDADPRMYVKGQFYTAPTFGDGFTQVGFGRFRDMLVWTGQFLDAVGRLPRVEWDYP